jgi:cobalt transporter subunit CbtB
MSSIPGLLDNIAAQPQASTWKGRILPSLLAVGLGLVLIYASAFAQTAALHNAAHDGRHSAGFPCH